MPALHPSFKAIPAGTNENKRSSSPLSLTPVVNPCSRLLSRLVASRPLALSPFDPPPTTSVELDELRLVNQDLESSVAQWKQRYLASERSRVTAERRTKACVPANDSPPASRQTTARSSRLRI